MDKKIKIVLQNGAKPNSVLSCPLCKKVCHSVQQYYAHIASKGHIKKNAGVVTTHGFKCEVCDVTCTSAENLNTHVKGKKHLRIVRAAEDMAKKDEGVELEKEEAVEKTDGVLGEEENDDSEENCVVYSEGGVVNGKTCLVCAAYCRPKVVSCCKSCYNNFLTSFRV